MIVVLAEPIGHLGYCLKPPLVREPPIVIIYYIILLYHLEKKNGKVRPKNVIPHPNY